MGILGNRPATQTAFLGSLVVGSRQQQMLACCSSAVSWARTQLYSVCFAIQLQILVYHTPCPVCVDTDSCRLLSFQGRSARPICAPNSIVIWPPSFTYRTLARFGLAGMCLL